MTNFKTGDRVRYTDAPGGSRTPGETGTVTDALMYRPGAVFVNWDKGSPSPNSHGARYLELIPAFKPGDRVTVRLGVHAYNEDFETGYVREVREGSDGHPRQLVLENGHWGYVKNAEHAPATPKLANLFSEPSPFAAAPRPLVGPAPTPPEAPRFIAPFSYRGGTIFHADGAAAFDINLRDNDTDRTTRDEFGKYVATALNASVFTED